MFAFLKPYTMWIVGAGVAAVLAAFGGLWLNLTLTQNALDNARGDLKQAELTIKAQERAIEAVDRVDHLEEQLDRLLASNHTRIMQAQGANDAIPPEVGAAFIANSDSVLAYRGNPRSAQELHIPQ